MADDKRETERVFAPGRVSGEVTVYQPMTVLDLGHHGAQVETEFPLHQDSLHDLRLSLDALTVVVKARIVHCQIGDIRDGTVVYRTGVEFVELSEHAAGAIDTFVAALQLPSDPMPAVIDAELADDAV